MAPTGYLLEADYWYVNGDNMTRLLVSYFMVRHKSLVHRIFLYNDYWYVVRPLPFELTVVRVCRFLSLQFLRSRFNENKAAAAVTLNRTSYAFKTRLNISLIHPIRCYCNTRPKSAISTT